MNHLSAGCTIGVTTPYNDVDFERVFLAGVRDAAARRNVRTITFVGGQLKGKNSEDGKFRSAYELISSECLDGLIVTPQYMASLLNPQQLHSFISSFDRIPIVCVDKTVESVPVVIADHREAMRRVLSHLVTQHNCQKVVLLEEDKRGTVFSDAFRGLGPSFGLDVDQSRIRRGSIYFKEYIEQLFGEYDSSIIKIDGIVTTNYLNTIAVLEEMAKRGLLPGRELALATFAHSAVGLPALVAQEPLFQQGEAALNAIVSKLEGNDIPAETIVPYPPENIRHQLCGYLPEQILTSLHSFRTRDEAEAAWRELRHIAEGVLCSVSPRIENVQETVDSLFNCMSNALKDETDRQALFRELDALSHQHDEAGNAEGSLHALLVLLHASLFFRCESREDRVLAQRLFVEAYSRLNREFYTGFFKQDTLHDTYMAQEMHVRMQHASASTCLDELRIPLSVLFRRLGIRFCCVNVFEIPDNQTQAGKLCRCVFRYENGNCTQSAGGAEGEFFSAGSLSPGGRDALPKEMPLALFPVFTNEVLGFMLIEANEEHIHKLQEIRLGVSTGIGSVRMFEQLRSRNESLYKMNQRLKSEIARREDLREQLIQSHKMEALGRVVGGVAHDFNNLLTIITGNCMYLSHMLPDASGKKQVDEALSASKMASELVDQLLSFSRKKEHAADVQPYDLNELICGMESLVKSSLGKKILLDTQLCDIPLSVRVDSTSVKQILLNLAVNARDAMPREGRFTIRTRFDAVDTGYEFSDSKNWIVLEIADTGSGMDEETRKKAFEPFFTTKSPGKGTGMGLATVYGVVKQNQGTIDIKSAPGQGTRFIIRLPVAR